MVKNRWIKTDDGIYYFTADGSAPPSGYYTIDGIDFRFTKKGCLLEGWYEQNGKKFYFVEGIKSVGWKTIDGAKYYFNENGKMLTDTVIDGVTLGSDGKAI